MVLATQKITQILDKLNEAFPALQRITAYALPKNLNNNIRRGFENK